MEDLKKPEINLSDGEKIWYDVTKSMGISFFTNNEKIPYTWQDFTNLVAYERQSNKQHINSACIAVHLMKAQINKYAFRDPRYNFSSDKLKEAQEYLLGEVYMSCIEKIKNWNYESGIFFDRYWGPNVKDCIRSTENYILGYNFKDEDRRDALSNSFSLNEVISGDGDTVHEVGDTITNSSSFTSSKDLSDPAAVAIQNEHAEVDKIYEEILGDAETVVLSKKDLSGFAFLNLFLGGRDNLDPDIYRAEAKILLKDAGKGNDKDEEIENEEVETEVSL